VDIIWLSIYAKFPYGKICPIPFRAGDIKIHISDRIDFTRAGSHCMAGYTGDEVDIYTGHDKPNNMIVRYADPNMFSG